jgi:PPP family 3-phenylpropionic acid transporter
VAVEASHGLSFSLFLVSGVEYVNRQAPREWRATGQTLFSAAYFGAGGIVGNTWAGYLFDRLGVQGMFRVNGFIVLTMALLALAVLRERRAAAGGEVAPA